MADLPDVPQLQFFVCCRQLLSSTPRVALQLKPHGQPAFTHFGFTEVAWNTPNPDFTQSFLMDYMFEELVSLRFVVYSIKDKRGDVRGSEIVGFAETTIHEVVSSQGRQLIKTLRLEKDGERRGHIIIRAEEVMRGKDLVRMRIVGKSLEDRGWFCHQFHPGFSLSRAIESGGFQVVYKSDPMTGCTPSWPALTLPIQLLCNNDPLRPVQIEVYDCLSNGKFDSLGVTQMSLQAVTEGNQREFKLVHPDKARKRGYSDSGIVALQEFEIVQKFDFLDYIAGGCQINLVLGIDFTSSNGDVRHPTSLHYLSPQGMNYYEKALSSVGEILLNYDSDKLVPAYGFGGKFLGAVNHCFPLNFSSNPSINGLPELLRTYRESFSRVELSGPTLFSPLLQTVVTMAETEQVSQLNQQYYFLLIITDGTIHDMSLAVDWIVRGSAAPMSIVIVGVGDEDFGNMSMLDADDVPLIDSHGKPMERDIVQFVPFRDCENNPAKLTKEVLAEIPREIVNFFERKGIRPNPPLPKSEYDPGRMNEAGGWENRVIDPTQHPTSFVVPSNILPPASSFSYIPSSPPANLPPSFSMINRSQTDISAVVIIP